MWRAKSFLLLLFSRCTLSIFSSPGLAQVIPDNTLGSESSIVTPNDNIDEAIADLIEGGAVRDNNLFHSFSEFNVSEGGAAYFANPDGIANILTRITGNSPSKIFGTLGVNGAANLFLLNPNGIVFGENAALDLNGSFFATTAESYILAPGSEFSATQPETAPLLKVNLTPGLQLNKNSGAITVLGTGHSLTGGLNLPLSQNDTPQGLQVAAGQTLGLIGNQIDLTGGILKTVGGSIQLVSAEEGAVKLNNSDQVWQADSSAIKQFKDIQFADQALIDASGIMTGNIYLQGKDIVLEDASAVIIQNLGSQASGKIRVNAANSVKLLGSIRNAPDQLTPFGLMTGVAFSRLTTETLGLGNAGDIEIQSNNLTLADGGHLASRTYSNADTGNININVDNLIEVDNYSPFSPEFFGSIISTTTFNLGNAGQMNISAKNIEVTNGGTISSISSGDGRGGEVKLDIIKDLVVNGINPNNFVPSAISSSTVKKGDSGNLTINTGKLSLLNRGVISTSTLAEGNAGQLTINAGESIEVISPNDNDPRFTFNNSGIGSDARIAEPFLRQLVGAPDVPSGDSGNITLSTPRLMVKNNAEISVSNQGLGNSGNLKINAEQVGLENQGKLTAFSASGQGGNIDLNIENSLLLDNSSITAQTTGDFNDSLAMVNGGNLAIDAALVTLLNKSQINANALAGNGGEIEINTQGLFVADDSSVTASSEFGLDGNININTLSGDRPIELNQLPVNPNDSAQKIATSCGVGENQFAIAGKGGLAENPVQILRGQTVWQDLRSIKSSQGRSRDMSQDIKANQSDIGSRKMKSESALVEAQAWRINKLGKVELFGLNATINRPNVRGQCS